MRLYSFESAKFSRHFDIELVVLMAGSSIVRSRKRKLRELYAVATDADAVANLNKFDIDAPPSTPAETKFLLDADILQ